MAKRDGRVVGWISLKVDYIDGLYVDPRHAGTGIGSNLLRYLEGSSRQEELPLCERMPARTQGIFICAGAMNLSVRMVPATRSR